MAPKTKFYLCSFVAIFIFSVVIEEAYGCHGRLRCFYEEMVSSRKVPGVILKRSGTHVPMITEDGEKSMARDLRTAPSGPDLLHHNGGTYKKLRIPS